MAATLTEQTGLATTLGPVVGEVAREIAHAVETEANVKAVFGAPIELGDKTVIPVASVWVSFGGGGGVAGATGLQKTVEGAVELASRIVPGGWGGGGAGGVQLHITPVGFIHGGPQGAVFAAIPRGGTGTGKP